MARFADVNSVVAAGAAMFNLKTVLKLAGWTTTKSSDGTTYDATGDQITTGTSGAGGMLNNHAWYVVRDPGSRRQVCVQNNTSGSVRVKMSELAGFVGGSPSATRVPSATDEQVLYGAGTDASPTYTLLFGGSARLHCWAESNPIGNVYGFGLFETTVAAATQASGQFFCEAMAPGSYRPADASPCVWYINSTAFAGTGLQGYFAFGLGGQAWSTAISTNAGPYGGALGVNLVDSADDNGYPTYVATITGSVRIKGVGSAIAAKGPARTYPATANTATDAKVYLGSWCYPYPNNTVPSVS